MADQKITSLTADTAPTSDDLVVTVNDPGGTPANRKVTLGDLAKGIGVAWVSWTPTWVNLTIGNATVDAKYMQIGKTVYFRVAVVLGNTTSVGSAPTFTLPVTSIAVPNADMYLCGAFWSNGANSGHNGWIAWVSTTTGALRNWDTNNDNGSLSSTNPFVWTTNNKMLFQGFYEAA